MRIWDLKQGTSLHVLKGRQEANHLGAPWLENGPFWWALAGKAALQGQQLLEGACQCISLSMWMPAPCYQGAGRSRQGGSCSRGGF